MMAIKKRKCHLKLTSFIHIQYIEMESLLSRTVVIFELFFDFLCLTKVVTVIKWISSSKEDALPTKIILIALITTNLIRGQSRDQALTDGRAVESEVENSHLEAYSTSHSIQ